MESPELDQDESILLESRNVKFKSISFDAILTTRRIHLTDSKKNVIPSQDITLATIRNVETGENAIRDHFLILSLVTDDGEKHQVVLTFARQAGVERKRECNEWAKKLKSLIPPSALVIAPSDVPVVDKESLTKREVPTPTQGTVTSTRPAKKKIEIARQKGTIIETGPGSSQPEETSPPPSGSFCTRCGNRVPLKSTFCNSCGTPITQRSELSPGPKRPASEEKVSVPPRQPQPVGMKEKKKVQPPAPQPVVTKVQEPVQPPAPQPVVTKVQEPVQPPAPQPVVTKVQEPVQPPAPQPVVTKVQEPVQPPAPQPVVTKVQEPVQPPAPQPVVTKVQEPVQPPAPQPVVTKVQEPVQPPAPQPVVTKVQEPVQPPAPQPVVTKVQEPVQPPAPQPVVTKVQEPVQPPAPQPVVTKVQEPVQPPAPQPVVTKVQEPVQPPAGSVGERQGSSIGQIFNSIEPLINDSVHQPRDEPSSTESQAVSSPQVVWPVFSHAQSPPPLAKEASHAAPASPPIPVPDGKKPNYLAIGVLIMAILPILAGLVIVANIMSGPSGGPANTTPVITVPTTLPPQLPQTTSPPAVTVTLVPGSTQVMIPSSGIWVRVSYPGTYIGLIGTPGNQTEVTAKGDHLYQILATERTVAAALQKNDSSGDQIILEVYKNGVMLKRETSIAPKAIVEILLDIKTL